MSIIIIVSNFNLYVQNYITQLIQSEVLLKEA